MRGYALALYSEIKKIKKIAFFLFWLINAPPNQKTCGLKGGCC